MMKIPLIPVPAQSFKIVLDNQDAEIALYWRGDFLYADIDLDGERIRSGQICLNRTPLLLHGATAFAGNLAFYDERGDDEPRWDGLGERWNLYFLSADEAEMFNRTISAGTVAPGVR